MEQVANTNGGTREHWLQVQGDPSIRNFVFQQTRFESEFDQNMDKVLAVAETLLMDLGIFQVAIHFSSNQLTCWSYLDPFRYHVYVGRDVLAQDFLASFQPFAIRKPAMGPAEVRTVLAGFRRLRFKDEHVYLRNGSINIINGMVSMSFSCDGSHYLSYDKFLRAINGY